MPLMRIFFDDQQTKGKIGKTRDLIVWHFEGLRSFREEAAFNSLGLGICKAFKTFKTCLPFPSTDPVLVNLNSLLVTQPRPFLTRSSFIIETVIYRSVLMTGRNVVPVFL